MSNSNLCENSKDVSEGLYLRLLCNITNDTCTCYRQCQTQKIRMLPSYKNCPLRATKAGEEQNMATKKETEIVEETKTEATPSPTPKKQSKPKTQKKICDIMTKSKNRFSINFDNYGISISDTAPTDKNKVEITYTGEFGTKSFNIVSHRFI